MLYDRIYWKSHEGRTGWKMGGRMYAPTRLKCNFFSAFSGSYYTVDMVRDNVGCESHWQTHVCRDSEVVRCDRV